MTHRDPALRRQYAHARSSTGVYEPQYRVAPRLARDVAASDLLSGHYIGNTIHVDGVARGYPSDGCPPSTTG